MRRPPAAVPRPPAVPGALEATLDALLSSQVLAGDQVGFILMDAHGAVVAARNADDRLIPASCRKVLSTACALSALGPTDRIATRVEARGEVSGSLLDGDLVLMGGGDPSLDDDALAELANKIAALGIRQVTGRVIGDGSAFEPAESYPDGWSADDLAWSYAPPISGLVAHEDRIDLQIVPGTAAGAQTAAPHPASYAARRFQHALEAAGIRVDGSPTQQNQVSGQILATHLSAPLAELVARTNKPSDNLFAEMLLRQLALAEPGASVSASAAGSTMSVSQLATGSTAAAGVPASEVPASTLGRSLSAERDWLGFAPGTYRLVDGSGLSRYDLLTSRQIALVLLRMRSDPMFVASLPVAGRDGTLARRLVGTPAEGQVHAKTGSMSGVSTLAGYVGDRWIVVFMDNSHVGPLAAVRTIQDAICVALAGGTAQSR